MKNILAISIILSLLSCNSHSDVEDVVVEDVVVIGGGLMGSSTGWALSNSDLKVTLIEKQDSIYTSGSSFGEARISRSLGPKGDIFSYLQQQSVAETEKLINYLNEAQSGSTHAMEDIYTNSPVTYIRYQSQSKEVEILLDEQQDTYIFAPDSITAADSFGMSIPDSAMIIREYKNYSGTMNPQVLISKLQLGMKLKGNRILNNQKVISLKKSGEFYEVKMKNTKTDEVKTLLSKKIVVAAGPYNGTVVRDIAPYFQKLITPKRLFLSFLKIKPSVYQNLTSDQKNRLIASYPVAEYSSEIFYSMIEKYDDEDLPILKIGGHFLRTEIESLDEVWEKELTEEEIEWSVTNTIRYLKMLNLPITPEDLQYVDGYSCVYSLTDTEVPYVTNTVNEDNVIDKNIVLVGGMSGIGAKGSLTYGLIASDILLNKKDTTKMYQKTRSALGSQRLLEDLSTLNTSETIR